MKIYYIGDPPATLTEAGWNETPLPYTGQHLFDVDGVLIFGNRALSAKEGLDVQLLERSGRPSIRFGPVGVPLYRPAVANVLMLRDYEPEDNATYESWLESRPRTNYASIGCAFYDHLEAAILSGKSVSLAYRRPDGEATMTQIRVLDTKTFRSEEFLWLEDDCYLRMDRILSVDGILATGSCTY